MGSVWVISLSLMCTKRSTAKAVLLQLVEKVRPKLGFSYMGGKIEAGDKNAGTRENGPGHGRVRGHRLTGAARAYAAKGRCSGGLHALI